MRRCRMYAARSDFYLVPSILYDTTIFLEDFDAR
jgi:hypothetical protein